MKRSFSYLLFVALCIALLAGCVPTPARADGEEDTPDFYETEFIIYQINGISQSGEHPMLCTEGTDRADMVLKRISEIEKAYNCIIDFSYNEHTDGVKDLLTASATSQHVADLVVSENIDNIHDLVWGEMLYDILALNDIINYGTDTFDVYGAPEDLEAYMYRGQLLAVAPMAHPGYHLHRGAFILADTEIVSEYTGLDLREAHEQEKWNWNMLEKVIKECTVKEDGGTKIYGASFSKRDLIEHALGANGYSVVDKNSAGNYTVNKSYSNALAALDWCRRIITEYADCVITESGWRVRAERFVEGGSAIVNMSGRYLTNHICYKKENFALLPFPCGPNGTYGEHRGTGNIYQGISIYNYAEDPDSCALILKAYCQPFAEYPDGGSLREYYQYVLWDDRDIELLFDPLGSSDYNYNPIIGDDFYGPLANRLLSSSSAQLMQTYLDLIEDDCEEWIIPNYRLIDELYGE